jgi:hypothetical protein
MASYFMRHGFYLMGVPLRGVRRVREVTGVRGDAFGRERGAAGRLTRIEAKGVSMNRTEGSAKFERRGRRRIVRKAG